MQYTDQSIYRQNSMQTKQYTDKMAQTKQFTGKIVYRQINIQKHT